MTNDEIVAQVLLDEGFTAGVSDASAAVVAALTEAGRLVPDWCVAIERGQLEQLEGLADWAWSRISAE